MKQKRHSTSLIIDKLRQVEAVTSEGKSIAEAVKSINVSEQTYYRWKAKYGKMDKQDIRRLKELERENLRLKKLLAERVLDNEILKEALEGKY